MNLIAQELVAKRRKLQAELGRLSTHGQRQLSQLTQHTAKTRANFDRDQSRVEAAYRAAIERNEKLKAEINKTLKGCEQLTNEIAGIDAALTSQTTEKI